MTRTLLAVITMLAIVESRAQSPVPCAVDSPERRGLEGCSILASRPIIGSTSQPLHWHIDRFDSLDAARKAAGPDSVAAQAHGSFWLLTVEHQADDHHGGTHVARIGPLQLPEAKRYTMRVLSTRLAPGSMTPVHRHPGPEVFYIVSGEQCLQTEQAAHRIVAGQSYVLPADTVHRGRIISSRPRAGFGLVLHDEAKPGTHDLVDPPVLAPCEP